MRRAPDSACYFSPARRLAVLVWAVLVLAAAPGLAKTVDVAVTPTGFSPSHVTLYKGDSIRWVNLTGQVEHLMGGQNCVADGSIPILADPIISESDTLYPYGGEFTWGFSDLGTFHYFSDTPGRCEAGMQGSFTVEERPYQDLTVSTADLVLTGGRHEYGRVKIQNGYDVILAGDAEIVVWGWGDADHPDSQAFLMNNSRSRIYCQGEAKGANGRTGSSGEDGSGAGGGSGTSGSRGTNGCSLKMIVYGDFNLQYGSIDLAGRAGGSGGGGGAGGNGHSCESINCEGGGCLCTGGAGGSGGAGGAGAEGGRGGSFTLWAYGAANFAEQFLGGILVDGGAGGGGGGSGQGGFQGLSCADCELDQEPANNGAGGLGARGGDAGRIEIHAREIGKGVLSAKGGSGGAGGDVPEGRTGGAAGAPSVGGDGGKIALYVHGGVGSAFSANVSGGAGGKGGGKENSVWELAGEGRLIGFSGASGGRGGQITVDAESFAGTAAASGGAGGSGGAGENYGCYCEFESVSGSPVCRGASCQGASGGSGSPGGSAGDIDLALYAEATQATLTGAAGGGGAGGCGRGATATCVWVDNAGTADDYYRCDREWNYSCGAGGGAGASRTASVSVAPEGALSVDLSVDNGAIQPGGLLTYLLSYKSRSASGLDLTFTAPQGTTLTGASGGGVIDGDAVRWRFDAGESNPGYLAVGVVVDGIFETAATITATARAARDDGKTASDSAATKVLVDVDKTLPEETALGQDIDNPIVADPVNPAIGNWTFSKTFFTLRGRSLPVDFTINYNSAGVSSSTALGYGWSHSLATKLTLAAITGGTKATLKWGDGREEYFKNVGAGFAPADCVTQNALAASGSGYALTLPQGTVYAFTSSGALASVTDANGNKVTYVQGAYGPTQITDSSGNAVALTYASGRLSSVSVAAAGISVSFQYDASGNPVRITDPRGNAYVLAYDGSHRVLVLTDRRGKAASTNVYDGNGRIVSQTDAAGETVSYAYEAADAYGLRRVTVSRSDGDAVVYVYDGFHNLVEATDGEGRTASFDYDASGRRTGLTAKSGGRIGMTRNASGAVTGVTGRGGGAVSLIQNAKGRPTRLTKPGGASAEFGYDGVGNLTTVKNVIGKTTTLTRNAAGQITRMTDPAGGVQSVTLNAKGYVDALTNVNGDAISYAYDVLGRITRMTFSDGSFTQWTYDANGNVTTRLDPGGRKTTYAYDQEDHRIRTTIDPDGLNASMVYGYDDRGLLVSLTDPLGGATTFENDAMGQPVRIVDADGVTVIQDYDRSGRLVYSRTGSGESETYAYDADGDLARMTDGSGAVWAQDYDPDGKLTRTVDPLGGAAAYAYDADGGLVSMTDETGRTVSYDRDALGRVTASRSPSGAETRFGYDAANRLTSITDPLGKVYGFTVNSQGLPTRLSFPDGTSETRGYDALGNMTSLTTRRGKTFTYAYTLAGLPASTTLPDGAGTVTTTYDAAGNPLAVSGPDGQSAMTYDKAGRLTRYVDPYGNALSYGYTAAGRLASVAYPGGKTLTYAYDDAGRLATVTDWLGGTTALTYDAAGRVTAMTLPNGVVRTNAYDAAGRPVGVAYATSAGTNLYSVSLGRDAAGRIVSRSEERGAFAPAPTSLSASLSYATQNRLTTMAAAKTTSYVYDADGTLISKNAGGTATAYALDAQGRLASVSGASAASFAYDNLGGRIAKTVGGVQTRYLTQAGRTYCALNASNVPQTYYIHIGPLAYRLDASGARYVYLEDERGSVTGLADADQTLVKAMAYGPYGALIGSSGTLADPFGFLGGHGVMTDETGLLHMGARYYDPEAMRFVSEDPLGLEAGINLYAYADADPVNRIDPTGLDAVETTVKSADTLMKVLATVITPLEEPVKSHPKVKRAFTWAENQLKNAHIQAIAKKMGATTFKEKKYYKNVAKYIEKTIATSPKVAKTLTKAGKYLPLVDLGLTGIQIYVAKTSDDRIVAIEEGIIGQLPGGDTGLLIGGIINSIPGVQTHVTRFGRVFFIYPDSYDLVSKKWWRDFIDKKEATAARIDAKIEQMEKLGLLNMLQVESPYD